MMLSASLEVMVTVGVKEGFTVTAIVLWAVVPQGVMAETLMFPDALPKVTVMERVPVPPVMTVPSGTFQV
jgi:hypothetical protein